LQKDKETKVTFFLNSTKEMQMKSNQAFASPLALLATPAFSLSLEI